MPVIGNNPWYDAANLGQGIGGGISSALVQFPESRARAQLLGAQLQAQKQNMAIESALAPYKMSRLAQQAGASKGQADMYTAHAGLYNQQAANAKSEQEATLALGHSLAQFGKESMQSGNVSPETVSGLVAAMGSIPKFPNLMKQVQDAIALGSSHLSQNPSLGAAVMTGAKVPMQSTVNQGQTAYNTMTGQPTITGTEKLNPGQSFTPPVSMNGQPIMPGSVPIAAQSPVAPQMKGQNPIPFYESLFKAAGNNPDFNLGTNADQIMSNANRMYQMIPGQGTNAIPTRPKRVRQNGIIYEDDGKGNYNPVQ